MAAPPATAPSLFVKGSWTLPYTFERINQALHRVPDDPMDHTPRLTVCGIGKAINTVAILYNVIQDQQTQRKDWSDYDLQKLGTTTISDRNNKPRTQLSFALTAAAPGPEEETPGGATA